MKPYVPTTVTPKGVEHVEQLVMRISFRLVPTTVTPKGVEHFPSHPNPYGSGTWVPTTVTPKGVEHYTLIDP